MTMVSMTVNGRAVRHEVEGRTLLVELLRDGLRTDRHPRRLRHLAVRRLRGPDRRPRGQGLHVFAADLEGADVRTIEGMANPDGSLGVIQAAFQEHHGLQCGFCTPGMVMTADALLRENADPSEAEIRDYLQGNICRCTGYHNIVKAIQAAAAQLSARKVAAE